MFDLESCPVPVSSRYMLLSEWFDSRVLWQYNIACIVQITFLGCNVSSLCQYYALVTINVPANFGDARMCF